MIAHRFRPVVWVAGCAVAATALYTVSLSVAAERTRLEDMDRQIAMTQNDIRELQTEMGTRASLRQLEKWNGEVLALSAPKADQFRANEAALATINGDALPAGVATPPPAMVAAATRPGAPAAAPAVTLASAEAPGRKADPVVRPDKPADAARRPAARPQRLAMLDRKLVNQTTFSEILVRAESESESAAGKGKSAQ
ncbi:MAG: hypothetical protein ACKOXK_05120 [Chakrabartia sp.]